MRLPTPDSAARSQFLSSAIDARVSPRGVCKLLAVIKTNAFGIYSITESGLANVGLGLYPLLALGNHQCDPSGVWSFEGDTIVLRATRPIRAGDAVTSSYLLPREPPAARQQKLRESYRFDCACARCVREKGMEGQLAAHAADFREMKAALERHPIFVAAAAPNHTADDGDDDMELTVLLQRCARLLAKLTPQGCCHPDTAVHLMQLGNKWWRLHQRALMAVQHGTRAKRPSQRVCFDQATELWRKARQMMSVSLGAGHPMLALLDAKLRV